MSVRHSSVLVAVAAFVLALLLATPPASADLSHARIIRLSLVEGDVRFTRDSHGDPLADSKNLWEAATLNLPIRQGYVLATDSGRATVEFENGAMAFLNQNTVLEFYDLSLDNGSRTTRLIVRQGSASFYVNSSTDYFSVTGGDFTVEATAHATFRLDNFDDGSTVNVSAGHVEVLRKNQNAASLGERTILLVQRYGKFRGKYRPCRQRRRFRSLGEIPHRQRHRRQQCRPDTRTPLLTPPATAISTPRLLVSHRRFSLRLAAFRSRPGVVTFAYGGWFQDPFFGCGLYQQSTCGLAPLSLRRVAFPTRHRLGLGAEDD